MLLTFGVCLLTLIQLIRQSFIDVPRGLFPRILDPVTLIVSIHHHPPQPHSETDKDDAGEEISSFNAAPLRSSYIMNNLAHLIQLTGRESGPL